MPNVLTLRFHQSALVAVEVLIDGQHVFDLDLFYLEDTFLKPPGPSNSTIRCFRKSENDRVIGSGFCDELCCPSTLAIVTCSGGKVTWTDIGERAGGKPYGKSYEFEQAQYEGEIAQILKLVSEKGY